jgi:cytochrome P450
MISNLLENFNYLSLIGAILIFYVTYYYFKYFNRINPLPGPIPIPLFGNLLQLYILHGGNLKTFFDSCHKKYGDLFEIYFDARLIILNRTEYVEKILSASIKNPYIIKTSEDDSKGYHELGIMGNGLIFNQEFKSWRYNRHFFTQAILSPKFVHEATYWTSKLFNELEDYWEKLYIKDGNKKVLDFSNWSNQFTNDMIITILTGERSYTMAGYFNELSDNEKAERPSALIDETVKFVHAIRKHLLGIILFQFISSFLRHYFPYFKKRSDDYKQNLKYLNQRFDSIIEKRRKEIEDTPLDKPLSNDMLTSVIIANTPRDVNYDKNVNERPMTDIEIRWILFDGIMAGTDTVSKKFFFFLLYFNLEYYFF